MKINYINITNEAFGTVKKNNKSDKTDNDSDTTAMSKILNSAQNFKKLKALKLYLDAFNTFYQTLRKNVHYGEYVHTETPDEFALYIESITDTGVNNIKKNHHRCNRLTDDSLFKKKLEDSGYSDKIIYGNRINGNDTTVDTSFMYELTSFLYFILSVDLDNLNSGEYVMPIIAPKMPPEPSDFNSYNPDLFLFNMDSSSTYWSLKYKFEQYEDELKNIIVNKYHLPYKSLKFIISNYIISKDPNRNTMGNIINNFTLSDLILQIFTEIYNIDFDNDTTSDSLDTNYDTILNSMKKIRKAFYAEYITPNNENYTKNGAILFLTHINMISPKRCDDIYNNFFNDKTKIIVNDCHVHHIVLILTYLGFDKKFKIFNNLERFNNYNKLNFANHNDYIKIKFNGTPLIYCINFKNIYEDLVEINKKYPSYLFYFNNILDENERINYITKLTDPSENQSTTFGALPLYYISDTDKISMSFLFNKTEKRFLDTTYKYYIKYDDKNTKSAQLYYDYSSTFIQNVGNVVMNIIQYFVKNCVDSDFYNKYIDNPDIDNCSLEITINKCDISEKFNDPHTFDPVLNLDIQFIIDNTDEQTVGYSHTPITSKTDPKWKTSNNGIVCNVNCLYSVIKDKIKFMQFKK